MKFLDVLSKKEYIDANGDKKTVWYCCGKMKITASGTRYLQFFHLPDVEYILMDREQEKLPDIQMN